MVYYDATELTYFNYTKYSHRRTKCVENIFMINIMRCAHASQQKLQSSINILLWEISISGDNFAVFVFLMWNKDQIFELIYSTIYGHFYPFSFWYYLRTSLSSLVLWIILRVVFANWVSLWRYIVGVWEWLEISSMRFCYKYIVHGWERVNLTFSN